VSASAGIRVTAVDLALAGIPRFWSRARIYDLRERNYEIKTERGERDTVYRLVAAPKPQQLQLV
jgi:hypothetical protein